MTVPSRMRGVSLIELAVSLSVLALAVTLAIPSWEQIRQKRDVTAAAEQLAAFLLNAQSSAVIHNDELTVSLVHTSGTSWCVGATLGVTACDCTITDPDDANYCAISSAPQIVSHEDTRLSQMTGHSLDTAFTFEPIRGLMINADLGSQHFFNFASEDLTYSLRVNIHPTGRVRICNLNQDTPVPGYADCPPPTNIVVDGGP